MPVRSCPRDLTRPAALRGFVIRVERTLDGVTEMMYLHDVMETERGLQFGWTTDASLAWVIRDHLMASRTRTQAASARLRGMSQPVLQGARLSNDDIVRWA